MALGPTQPHIQWILWAVSLGVKWPGHEAGHSPPYSAEAGECLELYLQSPILLHGVVLSFKESIGTTLPFPLCIVIYYYAFVLVISRLGRK
jgi:hypothetical protein